jgi:3-hydroxyisobutyrate dehydrogenase
MTTIAFLGLGNMGGPMAANLAAAGHAVHAFDLVAELRMTAEANGARVFDSSVAAVADADVVITSLPNGAIVKTCYAEILPAVKAGALLIDTSTISVDDARIIHGQAAEHGFAQVDAPVSGGVKGATAGTLAFMVGGDDHAVERATPVLEPMAGKIIHCGDAGTGQAAKVCNNMVLAVQQIAIGEAFVLAENLGLSAQSLFDVITGATGNCWSVHTNCPVPGPVPTSPANNEYKPGFATDNADKDFSAVIELFRNN